MNNNLDNPFYYLENFRFVLAWVLQRYTDLLLQDEIDFITTFSTLSVQSQALLVRMIMRRGDLFRVSKLQYQEIGDSLTAAQPLILLNWVVNDPCITVDQLYGVLTKNEFAGVLQLDVVKGAKKADLLELAQSRFCGPRRFSVWCGGADDALLEVQVTDMCDRLRLMFFGNLYQDWSEFVLADLDIFTYEKVSFSEASRAFQQREDILIYQQLHHCSGQLHDGVTPADVAQQVAALTSNNPWLQTRRAKILFRIGQEYERLADYEAALDMYGRSDYAGARLRQIRVLEKIGQPAGAHALAMIAQTTPESAGESQHLARILPRLQRKLGQTVRRATAKQPPESIRLVLPQPVPAVNVEEVARSHFQQCATEDAPVYYVENALINSLFGLLCWDALFCAVPGAFFHPFQTGPADLHSPQFRQQRAAQFQHCLSQLDSTQYQSTIRDNFLRKSGIASPFVYWQMLDETLLEQALACIPADHLKKYFERLLDSIAANRNGFPDLIQFWPQERRYRMIEVKGPGDRLQDNQIRFLEFCAQHQMPVAVCYVEWVP